MLHQDVPFEKLVQELAPERSLAHTPLFQVMLALQNAPVESLEIRGLRLRPVAGGGGTTAKFDLTLSLEEQDGELARSGRIRHRSVRRRDDRPPDRRASSGCSPRRVATPDRSVFALPLLSPAERGQVLVEWNDTGAASRDRSRQPACTSCSRRRHGGHRKPWRSSPDARRSATAIWMRAADRLAEQLRQAGAGPETVVGVCLERSAGMVIALLAILKAGAAYLPIDPALPRLRRDSMIEGCAGGVGGGRGGPTPTPLPSPPPTGRGAPPPARGSDLAVLPLSRRLGGDGRGGRGVRPTSPTSSTPPAPPARPKGVAVTHQSAVELVRWARTVYSPEELAGVLAATSLSFDLSVFELFVPLSWGGTVILAQNALELPELPARDRVTLVNTVPSAMAELVRAGSLRSVRAHGEPGRRAAAPRAGRRIYAPARSSACWNLYGPSEDTTYSTLAPVGAGDVRGAAIGRPVAGTQAYVLDGGAGSGAGGGSGRAVPRRRGPRARLPATGRT